VSCESGLARLEEVTPEECPILASDRPAPSDLPESERSGEILRFPIQDDRALVEALRAGSRDAGRWLFDRYGAHVERVVARVLGPDPEIPDLVQEVFVGAMASLPRLDAATSLKSWLTRIAVFKTRTLIRRRKRWRFVESLPFAKLPEREAPVAPPEATEALGRTYEIVSKLAVDERVVFALRFIDGMELTEIQQACDVSMSTIRRRIQRAREQFLRSAREHPGLRELLEEEDQ
jgi:RNA polymerase sigma-70 factor (ECF subfamily)